MTRPRCYNRPPVDAVRVRHGISEATGKPVRVELRNDWFTDRCTQYDGKGVGPNGESFADAHGLDCDGCRWRP